MIDQDDLLRSVVANPADEILRLVYADWLEESGDIRGEFLRLGFRLRLLPKDDERCREMAARLQELRGAIDPNWLAALDRPPIENCQVFFKFRCPKQWERLQTTEDPEVRFCPYCQNKVYYCASVEEARDHARAGHCLAVDSRVARHPGDLEGADFWIGALGDEK